MRKKKTIRKIRNRLLRSTVYISNIDYEAIRAWIALKFGSLLSFMIRNANQHVWEKDLIEGDLIVFH